MAKSKKPPHLLFFIYVWLIVAKKPNFMKRPPTLDTAFGVVEGQVNIEGFFQSPPSEEKIVGIVKGAEILSAV